MVSWQRASLVSGVIDWSWESDSWRGDCLMCNVSAILIWLDDSGVDLWMR